MKIFSGIAFAYTTWTNDIVLLARDHDDKSILLTLFDFSRKKNQNNGYPLLMFK